MSNGYWIDASNVVAVKVSYEKKALNKEERTEKLRISYSSLCFTFFFFSLVFIYLLIFINLVVHFYQVYWSGRDLDLRYS